MMNPSYPAGNGGGSGGSADLGPLTARVDAIEDFGVQAVVPTVAIAKSTPKAGTSDSTVGDLFPGFPAEASFLLTAYGFPPSAVTVRATDSIADVPASIYNPMLLANLTTAEGMVQVVVAAAREQGTFEIVGDAADRLGLSGSYAPGTEAVRRIATGHAVDHPASQQSVSDALITAQAKLAQLKLGQTRIRIPEDVDSLFSAMYQLGGAVSGATVQVVLNQRNTVENLEIDSNLSHVELIAGDALYPVYLGQGLTVSLSGNRGGWVVTVSGIDQYTDLTLVEPDDRLEFVCAYGMPYTGADSEGLAGEWPITSVDRTARTITFALDDIRPLVAGPCSLVATVVRCRLTGYPASYYKAVVDIRPGASLGGIGGISLVAPSGYSTSGLAVSGAYLGSTDWSSSHETLRCRGGIAPGVDIRPGGTFYSKKVVASASTTGIRSRGVAVVEEAVASGGGGSEGAGIDIGIGGSFHHKPGFLSVRGARTGVVTTMPVDLTGSVGITQNGDPGAPQVVARDGGRAIVTGTTYATSPAPNALAADGSYIRRA